MDDQTAHVPGGPQAPAVTPDTGRAPLEGGFDGRGGTLFKILFVNALLTVLTLGVYRFWAKTRVRQFLWNNARIGDDAFEYTGTGLELFKGFLVAVAILFPVGLVYTVGSYFSGTVSPYFQTALDYVFFAALFLLTPAAIYRAIRYRLSRTTWRGIRFGLDGRTWDYAKRWIGWKIVTVLSLTLAHPWALVALARFQMGHSRFGDRRFTFDGNGSDLFAASAVTFVLPTVAIVVSAILGWETFAAIYFPSEGEVIDEAAIVSPWFLIPVCAFLWIAVFGAWFKVVWIRYLLSHTHLDGVVIRSKMRFFPIFLAYVWAILALGGINAVVAVIVVAIGIVLGVTGYADKDQLVQFGEVVGFIGVFVAVIAFLFFKTLFVTMATVRQLTQTLTVENPAALDTIVQSAKTGPARGEGLADTLDVDVGF